MKIWTLAAAVMLTLTSLSADAARLGGGRSVGKQSGNVTKQGGFARSRGSDQCNHFAAIDVEIDIAKRLLL